MLGQRLVVKKEVFLAFLLPFCVATLFFEVEIASVCVLDLPVMNYDIYSGYFGDPIEFDGEN